MQRRLSEHRAEAMYMRMQQSELQWIRMTLRSAYAFFRPVAAGTSTDPRSTAWIDGQCAYYWKAARRDAARRSRSDRIGTVALALGFAVTALGLLLQLPPAGRLVGPGWTAWSRPLVQEMTTVPIALAALIGGMLANYAAKRNFASNAKRYDRMFLVFEGAQRRLKEFEGDEAARRAIIVELGREALAEHAEWLLTSRDRPLSFVT